MLAAVKPFLRLRRRGLHLATGEGLSYCPPVQNKPTAIISIPVTEGMRERIAAVADITTIVPAERARIAEALATAEGLLGSNQFTLDAALLDGAPKLRVVSNFGVGYNNINVDDASRRGIAVCNTPGVLNAAVVETTFLLMLAASRRMLANEAYVRSGGWPRRDAGPALGFDLAGKTLGILGYGRIGRAVADTARAFGMKVIFYDLVRPDPELPHVPFVPFPVLLRQSDILTIHVNLTPETTHMISAAEFAQMKPTAWIVNTSRGPVIDQAALAAALHKGEIAGAALDVLEAEPPDANDPILSAPNTILFPHIGSATVETRAAMLELSVANFIAVLSRNVPDACVNPEVLTASGAFRD